MVPLGTIPEAGTILGILKKLGNEGSALPCKLSRYINLY